MSIEPKQGHRWPADPFVAGSEVSVPGAWLRLLGCVAALAGLAVALPAPWTWFRPATAGDDPVQIAALTAGAGLVWTLLGWAFVVAATAAISRLPGRAGVAGRALLCRLTPAVARRVLFAAVGVSLLSGLGSSLATSLSTSAGPPSAITAASEVVVPQGTQISAPAWAVGGVPPTPGSPMALRAPGSALSAPDPSAPPADPAAPAGSSPVDLDWPKAGAPDAAAAPARSTSAAEVVVLRGDTLWSIAARRLPADASPDQIDGAWRAWYQANKQVIGQDPDLILPGQRLQAPAAPAD